MSGAPEGPILFVRHDDAVAREDPPVSKAANPA